MDQAPTQMSLGKASFFDRVHARGGGRFCESWLSLHPTCPVAIQRSRSELAFGQKERAPTHDEAYRAAILHAIVHSIFGAGFIRRGRVDQQGCRRELRRVQAESDRRSARRQPGGSA